MDPTFGTLLGNGGISGWALGILIVVGFMTGRIKTRRDYDDCVARADKAEEHARYWQQVAEQRSGQINELLPTLDTQTRLIQAMVERSAPDGER